MWTGPWRFGSGQGSLTPTARRAIESIYWSRWPDLPDMVYRRERRHSGRWSDAAGQIRQPAARRGGGSARGVASAERHPVRRRERSQPAVAVNEAEGDFAVLSERILAGLRFPDNSGGASRACHADWS